MLKSVNKHHPHGFSLIESLVALTILVVGLYAVVALFPLTIKITGDARNETTATNAALSQIELIRSITYDSLPIGTYEVKHRLSTDPTNYLYAYQRETTVETVDQNLASSQTDIGLKKISVTVYWQSPITQAEKSISFTTLVARY